MTDILHWALGLPAPAVTPFVVLWLSAISSWAVMHEPVETVFNALPPRLALIAVR